jgi:hypothetical protein
VPPLVRSWQGGIAWGAIGDSGVIQGCYAAGGNLKIVAALPCPKGFTPLQWNQQGIQGPPGRDGVNGINGTNGADGQDGQDGVDGVSVTSEREPAGAQCTGGGSKFTAANGVTYACNSASGQDGAPGRRGSPEIRERTGCRLRDRLKHRCRNPTGTRGAANSPVPARQEGR